MIKISKDAIKHKHTIINDLSLEMKTNPQSEFNKLNKSDLEVIDIICFLCAKYKSTHVSQTTIAKWTKLTRRQINRIMSKICKLGVVCKIFRDYNTSVYFMHDFFRDLKIKRALKNFIPNITLLAFSCKKLLSIVTTPIQRAYKPLNKMLHYYSPFFRDDKVEEPKPVPQPRRGGFQGIGSVLAGLNIRVKNEQ